MKKFKTNVEKELFDKRGNSIGFYIVRFIVNSIFADNSGVYANGFYYYENEDNQQIVLDNFNTPFSWEMIEMAEEDLPVLNSQNLKEAFLQRIVEFSMIQQLLESGQNFGTIPTEWEVDEST